MEAATQAAAMDLLRCSRSSRGEAAAAGARVGLAFPRRARLARREIPSVRVRRTGAGGVRAAATRESDGVKWWEKDGGPNFRGVHSTQEFVDALASAGDKLVVVEFFASWCGSCRALYPKLCKLAQEHPDVEFLKVNFEENKPMCKSLNVKVLPYFHFYRGAEGRVDDFSCSLSKLQKLRDAISLHNTDRCSIGPPAGAGNVFNSSSSSSSGNDQAAAATASSSSS